MSLNDWNKRRYEENQRQESQRLENMRRVQRNLELANRKGSEQAYYPGKKQGLGFVGFAVLVTAFIVFVGARSESYRRFKEQQQNRPNPTLTPGSLPRPRP